VNGKELMAISFYFWTK